LGEATNWRAVSAQFSFAAPVNTGKEQVHSSVTRAMLPLLENSLFLVKAGIGTHANGVADAVRFG
jgi:hypothetical protein